MKKLSFILVALVSLQSYAQIKDLQKSSDIARDKLRPIPPVISPLIFDNLAFVNPFVGTGGHGHTYPGASAPFGMMQLSPDTRHDGWDGCSGYHYSDSIIYGFSHTHLSGTGVSDYGDLLIVPQIGKPKLNPSYEDVNGYQATFSHKNETASPGYYAVSLNNGDMDVNLTVSERAGFHQYIFNKGNGKRFILIDLNYRDELLSSDITIIDKKTISGSRVSRAWANEQFFHFYLQLDTPYQTVKIFKKNGTHKLLLTFPKSTKQINIKVGMSHVNSGGAKLNVEAELPDWNFDAAKARVQAKWRFELNKIAFYSKDKEVMYNFYTALYHSFLNPNISNDIDGKYRYGDTIHQLKTGDYDNYTVFSLWDTYRAAHPLYTLTQVERTNAFINTFLRFYDYHKDLPVWELAGNETECMIGYHSVSVISDAFTKGIRDYDVDKALGAMITTSKLDEYGKLEYAKAGFLGTGTEPESVSKTLEYAYDDFCIYQMIKERSKENKMNTSFGSASEYYNRSMNFTNIFDPNSKFMRGRRSGQWHSPFDPTEVNFNYTEANSWQYSLYAPHAIGVLRDLIGGKDSLEMWLDRLFTTEMNLSGRQQADITGLIGQYAHGNEPSHHMAYLYNYTNAPEKTQYYIDKIQREMYTNSPNGLSGNEDCGQMSAWYIMSALGLYQIAPSRPYYEFGRPLMNEAKIELDNHKELLFKVNSSKENIYIQKVLFNSKELNQNYISHEDLTNGGVLEFVMGAKPNLKRESFPHAPTEMHLPVSVIPVPFFEQENRIFEDNMTISLDAVNRDNRLIVYTTDGSDPKTSSTVNIYSKPFVIDQTTTVRAFMGDSIYASSTITNTFVKKNTNLSIQIKSTYDNQYAASGDFSLIDGIRGGNEFRTGDWQGYWDQNLEATVTFEKPVVLNEVGVGLLSDMKSWVFFPNKLSIIVMYNDGSEIDYNQDIAVELEKDMYPHNKNFFAAVDSSKKVKQIRIKAIPTAECPEWNLGIGNPTWIFIDEIYFK